MSSLSTGIYIPWLNLLKYPPPPPPHTHTQVTYVNFKSGGGGGDFTCNAAEMFSFGPSPTRAKKAWSSSTCLLYAPNHTFRPYWCAIEFIDWRYSQSCWYFRPVLWNSAPLTFSLVHLYPPPPFPVWISTCIQTVCNRGARGSGGLRQINTCCQVPLLHGKYLRKAV